jgi:ribulose-phosphate 3-epimerase
MIVPAILENNWEEIEKKLEICREFAPTIHIDFIDEKFSSSKTFFDFEPFNKYGEYFNLEAHLMVSEPINYLEKLSANGFKKFMGHIEHMSDQVAFVARGEELGAVGLALDLDTPIDAIKVPLDDLDQILLMSINAGASGQKFEPKVLDKIKSLRSKYLGKIEIDGGINNVTLQDSKAAGANNFCVNTFLFAEEPKKQYRLLESLL